MFNNHLPLKREVIRYFRKDSEADIKCICLELANILMPYKNEEKIECIDRLINSFSNDSGNIRTFVSSLKNRCSIEINVFAEVKDYEASTIISNIKNVLVEFESDILSVSREIPDNKNEAILLQAEKIRLFDKFFQLTESPEKECLDALMQMEENPELYAIEIEDKSMYVVNPMIRLYNALGELK